MKNFVKIVVVAMMFSVLLCGTAMAAGSKSAAVETHTAVAAPVVRVTVTETKIDVITDDDAAAVIPNAPAAGLTVISQQDYSFSSLPAKQTINVSGTKGIMVYILQYINGQWVLIASGIGPDIDVNFTANGPVAIAVVNQ